MELKMPKDNKWKENLPNHQKLKIKSIKRIEIPKKKLEKNIEEKQLEIIFEQEYTQLSLF
tara:strand:+ start:8467 stop:8646 length:180 start_codon:yes stop_codon:yes gene_type:complete